MLEEIYKKANEFLKKYPFTITWRVRQHAKVMSKHINPDEKILYIFPAQKNDSAFDIFSTCLVAFTTQRILVVQKRVLPGYRLNSITPDLFNDFQVFKGFIFGRVTIDTAKEVVNLSDLDPKSLPEIETNLSEYLLKEKPKILKQYIKNE
ncbi:MAG: PH domain-containing protein [Bacilli bacterium]|nr:PH domain-containing protein [Bacilli bacterium]